MPLLHSDILCPYCLQALRAKDIKLACPLCGAEVRQSAIGAMRGRLPSCPSPSCHKTLASDKHCGHCGAKLPADIMDYAKYLRFSILGISGAGKTNFLTTMLHELRNTPGTPLVLAPMDPDTSAVFQINDQSIYETRRPVDATPPGMPPQPQQWRLRDRTKMTQKNIPSYSLTIFDGAGEDAEHIDAVISRYISGSKTLVVLIDPLALPGIRQRISENVFNWSTTAEHAAGASANMVNGLANYIRQSCSIAPGRLIDRDVAVVFTKLDAVKDSFGQSTVMQPSPHLARKGFVKADANAVDAEIRDWLASQGETAFLDAVDTEFQMKKVRFFGVSSFGQPPTGDFQLGRVMPHRVLDPLMWMLTRENIIPEL